MNKAEALNNADILISKMEENKREIKTFLKRTETFLKEFSAAVLDFDDRTSVPEKHRDRLLHKIEKGYNSGYLTEDQYKQNKESIKIACSFNPVDINKFHEIKDLTKDYLHARRRQAEKDENILNRLKSELRSTKSGIRAMSKTEAAYKSSKALSSVVAAVRKFSSTNEDGSPNAVMIVSGVGDIANAIATFLPPPATIITGVFSSVLDIFGAGGPTVKDVVYKEFKKMKKFTKEEFTKQKKFIRSQFENQKKFIREQTKQIITSIENNNKKTNEYIQNVLNFLKDDQINHMLKYAYSLMNAIDYKKVFIDTYEDKKINDQSLAAINNIINRVLDDTADLKNIELEFENICLSRMKVDHTIYENRICTNVLYTFLYANMHIDIALNRIVTMFYRSQKLKDVSLGYIEVGKKRKEELKTWIRKIFLDLKITCPLFITQNKFWDDETKMQKVLEFIQHEDPRIREYIDTITPENCVDITNKNYEEFCGCPEEKFISSECDLTKQCTCSSKYYTGENCDTCIPYYKGENCQETVKGDIPELYGLKKYSFSQSIMVNFSLVVYGRVH